MFLQEKTSDWYICLMLTIEIVTSVFLTYLQVDHLEDHLKSLSAFTGARDVKPGPCASYLEVLLYQIVSKCLVRHSRRARSEVVRKP